MTKNITCIICNKELINKQSKFCSVNCKNKLHQSYVAQCKRGTERKLKLLNTFGNKCSKCGYNKNWSSLCFHHLKDKSFNLTSREIANHKWERVLKEAKKCIVLCANCHQELHNPDSFF